MSFGAVGGAGGATEALQYFIRAYDMATPVFRAFGAEVEAVTKKVQASMVELDKALATQSKAAAGASDQQVAALDRVKAAQTAVADSAKISADSQITSARTAVAAADEQAAATARAAEVSTRAAEKTRVSWWTAQAGIARVGRNLTLMFAGASLASLDFAAKFQANTLRMQTQAGATVKQLAQIRTGLLQMSGQVGSTPDQLASGMYHIVSSMNAIIPPAQRAAVELRVMRAAAEGAQIGQSNLEDTAYALSAAMNALNQPLANANHIMGIINATVGSGDMTMQDYIDALKSGLIPTANSFGVSLSSVGSALAVLGDKGMRGAMAGTRLRMALSLLGAPTKQAAGILQTLGLSATQAEADTKKMSDMLVKAGVTTTMLTQDLRKPDGITTALSDLRDHLISSGLTATGAAAAISRAFGGGRMGAAIQLLVESTGRLQAKFQYINQHANTFGQDWKLTSETFRVQLDKMLASVEALGIKIGNWLMPYATDFLHFLRDGADWLAKNTTALEILGGAVITFSTVAIGAYFFSKMRAAIGLVQDLGLSLGKFGRWLFGIGAAPSASAPATEISTAIDSAGTKAAAAMGDSIQAAGVRSAEAMSMAMTQSMSRSLMVPVGGTMAAKGPGGLIGSLSSNTTGRLFGFMGSDILVGTMRNPISVVLAGQGTAAGLPSTAANAEKRMMASPAGLGVAGAAAADSGQLSLLDAEGAQVAAASQELVIAGTNLANMEASMLEWYAPVIKQMEANVAEQTKAAIDSANYTEFLAQTARQYEEQVALFGDDIAGLTVAVDKLSLSGAFGANSAITAAGATGMAGEQLGLGGLANYASRGNIVPPAYVPGFAPGATGVTAATGLSSAEQMAISEASLPGLFGGLSGLGARMQALPLAATTAFTALRSRISSAVGSIGSGLQGMFSGLGSNLLRGGLVAGMGTMFSQMVGTMVKGSVGGWIKSLGTGAALGVGAGMVIPGIGPLITGAIGVAVAAAIHSGVLKSLFQTGTPGDQVTGPLAHPFGGTSPGTGGIPAPSASLTKQISALITAAAALAYTPGALASEAKHGGIIGKIDAGAGAITDAIFGNKGDNQPTPRVMTPHQLQQFNQDMFLAGSLAAGSLEKGWNSYKFPSEPLMFQQFAKAAQKLPPRAQAAAAESAIHFAQGLEKNHRLPVGAADQLVADIRARFPGLVQYMGITATQASQAWTNNFNMVKWQVSLKNTLKSVGMDFAAVGFTVAHTTGTIEDKTRAGIAQLRAISNSILVPPAERAAAKRDMAVLTDTLIKDLENTASAANLAGQNILLGVTDYTAQASQVAAANMKFSEAEKNAIDSTQSIVKNIQQQWGLMQGATATSSDNMVKNMGDAWSVLEKLSKSKSAQTAAEASANLKILQVNANTYMQTMEGQTTAAIGNIASAITGGSQVAAMQGVLHFKYFAGQLQGLMAAGIVSTSQGMKQIQNELFQALHMLGSPVKLSDLKGFTVAQASSYLTSYTQGSSGGAGPGMHATGGRVPGPVGPDNWTLLDPLGRPKALVGGAELLIANRHTESRINQKLAMGASYGLWGNTTLGAEVAGETVPHSYALGGRLSRAGFGGSYSSNSTPSRGSSAPGSYVFPFPKGESFNWDRIDQGQDVQGPPGGPVLAIGPGNVSVGSDAFSGFGPFYPILALSAGPWAGRSVYYGHAKDTRTGPVKTGQVIGVTQARADEWTAAPAGWLEFGFTTALGQGIHAQGAAVAPMLHALAAGHMVAGSGGAAWTNIRVPKWSGPGGILGQVGSLVLKRFTDAANKYGAAQASQFGSAAGGTGGPAQFMPGGWVRTGATLDPTGGQTGDPNFTFAELLEAGANAGMRPDLTQLLGEPRGAYGMPMGTGILIRKPGSQQTFRITKNDVGSGQAGNTHYTIDLHPGIAGALGWAPNQDVEVHKKLGGRVGYAGAFGQGGAITVDQPTVALFGDNGRETAIFLPADALGTTAISGSYNAPDVSLSSPGTSTSYRQSTGRTAHGKPSDSTTSETRSTTISGNIETTTTYSTTVGTSGSHTTVTSSSRALPLTTGLNPLTDRIETHTSAEWHMIHIEYEKQRHDASLAKQRYDKWLQGHVTEMLTIGQVPVAVIEMTRKIARQEHFPLSTKGGGGILSLLDVGKLTPEGWKKVQTAVNEGLKTMTPGQVDTLSNTFAAAMGDKSSPIHDLYREFHDHRRQAEAYMDRAQHFRRRADEAQGRRHEKLLDEEQKYHKLAKDQWGKANAISTKIADSKPGQLEATMLTAAVKGIMAQWTQANQDFSNTSNVLSMLESVPPGSTAHSLGLSPIQLKALGISRHEIRKLAGADAGSTAPPFTFLMAIRRLIRREIPSDQATIEELHKQYRDAIKAHNKSKEKYILNQISKVTTAEIKAWTEVSKARDDFVNAQFTSAEDRLSTVASRSDALASIQNLAPGTNLAHIGLTHRVLRSMGFTNRMIRRLPGLEGSSSGYIQELMQEQNGKLTPSQLAAYKRGVDIQDRYLAKQRQIDAGEIKKLERELPHLRGTARHDAEVHIRDLSKNVLDLTSTIRENTKSVKDLTKVNNASTTSTGQLTGSTGYTFGNQEFVVGGSSSSERLINVNLA